MAKKLNKIDLLALPNIDTPSSGYVAFAAKSDGLYQKIGTVEAKLATSVDTTSTKAYIDGKVKTDVPVGAKFTDTIADVSNLALKTHTHTPVQVGLGNVTNESKATMFTNPAFTGTTTAPKFTATTNISTPILNLGAGWSFVRVGNNIEIQFNGVTKQIFTSNGDIVSVGEITAYQ